MSRSCTLLGFASHLDVSAENRCIDTSKWHNNSPLNTFANKSERTQPNDILAQGRGDYRVVQLAVNFSSVFAFISHWDVHVIMLHYMNLLATRKNRYMWHVASHEQCYSVHRFLMTSYPLDLSSCTPSCFMCSKTCLLCMQYMNYTGQMPSKPLASNFWQKLRGAQHPNKRQNIYSTFVDGV